MDLFRLSGTGVAVFAILAPCIRSQTPRFDDLHRMLSWDAGGSTYAVALADFDADGDLDAVFGTGQSGAYPLTDFPDRVYLNDGTGRLQLAPSNLPPMIDTTNAVAVGDVDGDGDSDLLFGNLLQDRLYLNDGSGVFLDATAQIPPSLDQTGAIGLGDVDGDGDLDAIVGNAGQDRLLLNNGTGVFVNAPGQVPFENEATSSLGLGDLDGDGDLDALVGSGGVRLYLNGGTGFFTDASVQISPPAGGVALGLGDLDGDGDLDALAGGALSGFPSYFPGPLRVIRNDGSAVFTTVTLAASALTVSLALGDVDGDGDLDALVGASGTCSKSGCGGGEAILFLNDGAGGFTNAPSPFPPTPGWVSSVVLGDLDGDADLDALTAGSLVAWRANAVYLNDGGGGFEDATGQVSPAVLWAGSLALGDLDGDGDVDAFASASSIGAARVLLNDGTGDLEEAPLQPAGSTGKGDVALGDVDGDGDLDAFAPGTSAAFAPPPDRLFINLGGAVFSPVPFPPGGFQTSAAALRDMDGDGDLDAVIGLSYGGGAASPSVLLCSNNGAGTFNLTGGAFPPEPATTSDLSIGDVDGDGDLDVLCASLGVCAPPACSGGQSRLYLNNGVGVFSDASAQLPTNAELTLGIALGDVDGDGDLDAYLANGYGSPTSSQDRLLLNDGAGFFSDATAQLPAENKPVGPATLLDADGDGDLDAWVAAPLMLQLYVNGGPGAFSDASSGLPVGWSNASDIQAGDLDGDGDQDVALADFGRIRILSSLARQLVWRALPRVGKPLTFDIHGPAWGAWFLVAAGGTGNTPLPPLGVIRLDLATLMPQFGGLLDAQGHVAVTYQVPAIPALIGQSLYWQAVVVGPARLTNLETTTFTNL
jgi:VCBS repeat protein